MRVLLVEDNPGDARLIEEMFRDVAMPHVLEQASSLALAGRRLEAGGVDIVLLDLGLPDSQGLDTLLEVRRRAPLLPLVVLTGFDDEERSKQALQLGAQDYLIKGQIESGPLSRALRYAVERNQADLALHQVVDELENRTAELEAFTYSVSHDLKEPLRTLEAFSRFLLEDYAELLDEQGQDYLTRLANASARLKDMIEELLVLSRLGRRPHQLEQVDVRAVVEGYVAANLYTIEQRRAEVVVQGDLPAVVADESRVEQIFGNLIGNGLKFNSSPQPQVEVGVSEDDGTWATFFVRDNGIGIAPEYHDRVFGIFQRLHLREEYEGTGAGLAIVKRAAEAVGGRVWIESEVGSGATFFVRLPLNENALAGQRRRAQEVVSGAISPGDDFPG